MVAARNPSWPFISRVQGAARLSRRIDRRPPWPTRRPAREFSRRFAEHLNRFGHAVYDLDFAKSVADDEPAPLLETLKYFLTGQAA